MIATYYKDPNAVMSYSIDWTAWLQGATITSSTWTIAPTGELAVQSNGHAAGVATVTLTDGVVGKRYKATNRITTSTGLTTDETLEIVVTDK